MFNLGVKTTIVPPGEGPGAPGGVSEAERLRNMQSALSDRQAVFKRSECAACHADPARGKTDGAQLYAAVCASCHDSPNRASVVPDLQALKHPTDFEHWRKWIRLGRAGSMMPAFAREEGGPLSDQQIDAIASHVARR